MKNIWGQLRISKFYSGFQAKPQTQGDGSLYRLNAPRLSILNRNLRLVVKEDVRAYWRFKEHEEFKK